MNLFRDYVMAGYPLLWLDTHEEYRALVTMVSAMSKAKEDYKLYTWDVVDGVRQIAIKDGLLGFGESIEGTTEEGQSDPMIALQWLENQAEENSVLFLKDFHPYMKKDPTLVRKIRNLIPQFKACGKVMCLISSQVDIPPELNKELTVIPFNLPTREELKIVLRGVAESAGANKALAEADQDALLDASLGMTSFEAENAFSVSLIEAKKFDPAIIRREKAAIVKKTRLLEVVNSHYTLDDIGGLENLKAWLAEKGDSFSNEAKEFGVETPKGALLVGVPGCGKSLTAKAVSSAWQRPLIRLDVGKVFGSYVGESEANMRKCLKIAEAIAPCVLWIDELEKSFAGTKGNQAHETTEHVFQEFLTWLQEKKADVFLVATANSVESLPPELLRPGRIDVTFWVDLPDEVQRREIFEIHLRKRGRDPEMFKDDIKDILDACNGFSGAEIEVWVKEALAKAWHRKHKDLQKQDLLDTAKEITPISRLMENDINRARQWAKNRGTKNASIVHEQKHTIQTTKNRKIQPSTGS